MKSLKNNLRFKEKKNINRMTVQLWHFSYQVPGEEDIFEKDYGELSGLAVQYDRENLDFKSAWIKS